MIDHTPKIIRALRKYHGVNQIPFAKDLGITQGTLSKIEKGSLELSAGQWVGMCQQYHLDPNALIHGKIEAIDNIALDVNKKVSVGNFKVSNDYNFLAGSTVRTVFPFIKFMENKIGPKETSNFLLSKGIDPDYFVIQNLPVNIKIIEDIFEFLKSKRFLTVQNVDELLKIVPASEIHGYCIDQMKSTSGPDKAIKKFTELVSSFYEVNSHYHFVGDDKSYIQARDNKHLNELKLSDEFMKFRALFNLSHFNNLAPLLHSTKQFVLNSVQGGWDIALA